MGMGPAEDDELAASIERLESDIANWLDSDEPKGSLYPPRTLDDWSACLAAHLASLGYRRPDTPRLPTSEQGN